MPTAFIWGFLSARSWTVGWLLFQVVPHCDRDQVVAASHSNVPSNSLSKKLIYTRNHDALSGNPKISFFDRNTNFIKDEQTFEEDNSEIFKTLRPLINHLFPPFIAPIHGIVVSLSDLPIDVASSCVNLAVLELLLVLFEFKRYRSWEAYRSSSSLLLLTDDSTWDVAQPSSLSFFAQMN